MSAAAPDPATGPCPDGTARPAEDHLRLHAARALEALVRHGTDLSVESVHDARTSLRRLRAAVRTVPALVEDPFAADAALQEVALALGAVRDVDVLAELLLPAADALVPVEDAEPARALLGRELAARRGAALSALGHAAGTPRRRQAESLLDDWARTPPPLPALDAARVLEHAEEVTDRRLAAAGADPTALHRARKAAKRWRYTAELLIADPAAPAHHRRAEELQELLGRIQDLEIARGLLDELRADDAGSGAGHAGRATITAEPAALRGLAMLRRALAARQRDLISAVAARTDRSRPESPRVRDATRGSAAPRGPDDCPAPGR